MKLIRRKKYHNKCINNNNTYVCVYMYEEKKVEEAK